MANKKNKNNRRNNTHKYVYAKKKLPRRKSKEQQHNTEEEQQSDNTQEQQTDLEEEEEVAGLEGSRVINLEKLQQYTDDLIAHSALCDGSITLSGETRDGLASILRGHCSTCQHTITFETSKKVKGPRGYRRWECNLAAVWGQMSTGGGHSQLEESMSVVGVPVMTKTSFVHTERDIGELWKRELQESMLQAGREERRIAIEKNSFHEDVPAITVIVDGGWCKRAHKHSYNAKSGVGIIIGQETGNLLYLGVRNKYCHACARKIPHQVCYKNWSRSSSEMETEIILDGFCEAERVHGLRYTRFIGDGDSAVYPNLIQNVPGWGHVITKLECCNHACKCYRGALEQLVKNNPSYKGSRGLTEKMRRRLVSAARCAIRMRSGESDTKQALASLKKDLINGPRHCFGIHTQCSPDFCTAVCNKGSQIQSHSEVRSDASASGNGDNAQSSDHPDGDVQSSDPFDGSPSNDDGADLEGVISDQEAMWRDTVADDDPAIEEEVRRGGLTPIEVDTRILYDVQAIVSRLVGKASQLFGNYTTNLAECWMNIRSKFDGGKVINRSQSGSWQHRCMGAGLQQNIGREWGPGIWTRMTQAEPNKVYSDAAEQASKRVEKNRKRKATDEVKERRRRSKYTRTDDTPAARRAYNRYDEGISPDEVTDDLPSEQLQQLCNDFYRTKVVTTGDKAKEIEFNTRQQSNSVQWLVERRIRITASKTGSIAKMRATTKRAKKVQELLYNTFRGNQATQYGLAKEEQTVLQYTTHQQRNGHPDLKVDMCGLCVSLSNPWLAASPDGFVSDPSEPEHPLGLLEIKNPYSIREKTLAEASETTSFCLEREKSLAEGYRLKQRHDYYFQIQCQLYCTGRSWCDFVLRTNKDMHIQRIYREESWWGLQLEKLRNFYFSALLPELACPRHRKGGIREPK